jgi:serine/threonine protein kinase
MGQVYRAFDTRLNRIVAIKVLSADQFRDPELRQRFLHEARAASALNHPNIVTLYDIASNDGVYFLVMEHVPGLALSRVLSSRSLTLEQTIQYAIQIASGLAAAHAKGIVHRDIKPSNVIVTPESTVKILDFGLAKLDTSALPSSESPTLLTGGGVVLGTVGYISPEQARGETVDARSDLFSFGAMLYEMATGRPAFPRAWDWTPPPASGIDSGLSRIIFKLLEPNREGRYEAAAEVVDEFLRLLAYKPAHRSRRFWLRSITAGTLAAIIASIVLLYLPAHRRLSDGNRRSTNSEANEYYERSLLYGGVGTSDGAQMQRMIQHALEMDPKFAAARAEYAFSFVVQILGGVSNDAALLYKADQEIRQALRNDPASGHAHGFRR